MRDVSLLNKIEARVKSDGAITQDWATIRAPLSRTGCLDEFPGDTDIQKLQAWANSRGVRIDLGIVFGGFSNVLRTVTFANPVYHCQMHEAFDWNSVDGPQDEDDAAWAALSSEADCAVVDSIIVSSLVERRAATGDVNANGAEPLASDPCDSSTAMLDLCPAEQALPLESPHEGARSQLSQTQESTNARNDTTMTPEAQALNPVTRLEDGIPEPERNLEKRILLDLPDTTAVIRPRGWARFAEARKAVIEAVQTSESATRRLFQIARDRLKPTLTRQISRAVSASSRVLQRLQVDAEAPDTKHDEPKTSRAEMGDWSPAHSFENCDAGSMMIKRVEPAPPELLELSQPLDQTAIAQAFADDQGATESALNTSVPDPGCDNSGGESIKPKRKQGRGRRNGSVPDSGMPAANPIAEPDVTRDDCASDHLGPNVSAPGIPKRKSAKSTTKRATSGKPASGLKKKPQKSPSIRTRSPSSRQVMTDNDPEAAVPTATPGEVDSFVVARERADKKLTSKPAVPGLKVRAAGSARKGRSAKTPVAQEVSQSTTSANVAN